MRAISILRRPPCEVVSWNAEALVKARQVAVDLLARSWVEMLKRLSKRGKLQSRPPCEVVSWNTPIVNESEVDNVDLLARSWVEMLADTLLINYTMSTSLRGRELKYALRARKWNNFNVDLLARSWVEIHRSNVLRFSRICRPPCEVVSWNAVKYSITTLRTSSTSLRGRELK